uniref:G-protein coupled receptors family 1 profile domain-containing protein n=1 Tax=Salmo trutta TaxID=8032 RepID=A0A673YNM1_SALTR
MLNKTCCVVEGDLTRVLPQLLLLEFVLGVLGNDLSITVFLLNIALPATTSQGWTRSLGISCRMSLFMLAMNRGESVVFFLMAVALDRSMRVVHPRHPFNSMSLSKVVSGAVGLWVLSISLSSHFLINSHQFKTGNSTKCESFTNKNKLHNAVFFEVPGISWDHGLLHQVARNPAASETRQYRLETAFYITISLTYFNSMLDPVVYYFLSPSFKRIYKKVLRFSLRQNRVGMSLQAEEHHPNRKAQGWQHHVVGVLCCRRDGCTLQNTWHHEEGK